MGGNAFTVPRVGPRPTPAGVENPTVSRQGPITAVSQRPDADHIGLPNGAAAGPASASDQEQLARYHQIFRGATMGQRATVLRQFSEPDRLAEQLRCIHNFEGIAGVSKTFYATLHDRSVSGSGGIHLPAVSWFNTLLDSNPELAKGIIIHAIEDMEVESLADMELLVNALPIAARRRLLAEIPVLKSCLHEAVPATAATSVPSVAEKEQLVNPLPPDTYRRSNMVKGAYAVAQTSATTAGCLLGAEFLCHGMNSEFFGQPLVMAAVAFLGLVFGIQRANANLDWLKHERESELPVKPFGTQKLFYSLASAGVNGLVGGGVAWFFARNTPEAWVLLASVCAMMSLRSKTLGSLAGLRDAHVHRGNARRNIKIPTDTPQELVALIEGFDDLNDDKEKKAQLSRIAQFSQPVVVEKLTQIALTEDAQEVRKKAMRALAHVGTKEGLDALLHISRTAGYEDEQKFAVQLLQKRGVGR